MDPNSWDVEVRRDGTVLVRVHSSERNGQRLPDAVFTFRPGDPQFEYWEAKWRERALQQTVQSSCATATLSPAAHGSH